MAVKPSVLNIDFTHITGPGGLVKYENIPSLLKDLTNWVLWRLETTSDGRLTKIPYQTDGQHASTTDPSTWNTFEEACSAYDTRGAMQTPDGYSGIGIVLTEELGLVGIDLDHCVDPATFAIEPWAREIVDEIYSYTEVSPSNTGLRIFCEADTLPRGRRRGHIEVYKSGRYLTVTGHHLPGTPMVIHKRPDEVASFYHRTWPDDPPMVDLSMLGTEEYVSIPSMSIDSDGMLVYDPTAPTTSHTTIAGAPSYAKGDPPPLSSKRVKALLEDGDWASCGYPSQSEADLALCTYLVWRNNGDVRKADTEFRASALMRGKWDVRHGADTYGVMTLKLACTHYGRNGQVQKNNLDDAPTSGTATNGSATNGHTNGHTVDAITNSIVLVSNTDVPDKVSFNIHAGDTNVGKVDGEVVSVGGINGDGGGEGDISENVSHDELDCPETDYGNAERLRLRHGDIVRHIYVNKNWLVWNGRLWVAHSDAGVTRLAEETARSIKDESDALLANLGAGPSAAPARAKWWKESENQSRIKAMMEQARSLRGIEVGDASFNSDPYLFNCANCTIDLRTGDTYGHRKSDYITHMSPVVYDPTAKMPEWYSFLTDCTDSDEELIDYLKISAGYTLTGDASLEMLWMIHGAGGSGKSTFIDALKGVLGQGQYYQTADAETFRKQRNSTGGAARSDIARLAGARAVFVVEVEQGQHLAEALVKQMTGGDSIVARALYQGEFEHRATYKIWIACNHAPQIDNPDASIWRRIYRVPFNHSLPRDSQNSNVKKMLGDSLLAGPTILNWMLEGMAAYRSAGAINIPKCVSDSTHEYRNDVDPLSTFINDCCLVGDSLWVRGVQLYDAYSKWGHGQGWRERDILSPSRFAQLIKDRYSRMRDARGTVYLGIGVVEES